MDRVWNKRSILENGNIAFADKQGKIHFVRRFHENGEKAVSVVMQ
ncbi:MULTISPECIES: hypothetical protein [unclassified Bacillus (in: firmicutes)]|nr:MULTISPECIES: hypothetical protein [unclassified Bacillus (in: firmicutes)]